MSSQQPRMLAKVCRFPGTNNTTRQGSPVLTKCCTKVQYAVYNNSTVQKFRKDMAAVSALKQTLTARQAQILELIRRHINDTGYPPTRADIALELGLKSVRLEALTAVSCSLGSPA